MKSFTKKKKPKHSLKIKYRQTIKGYIYCSSWEKYTWKPQVDYRVRSDHY